MGRILVISSHVSFGHVGLGAAVPVLQRLGHDVIGLPSVVLSNHAAHDFVAGQPVSVAQLDDMFAALDANGWLAGIDAVLTGYLPSVDHVDFAVRCAHHVRSKNTGTIVLCDPVLGDDPGGLYVGERVAASVRDDLVSIADITTPNRFEASWLMQCDVSNVPSAVSAGALLPCPTVLVSSVPSASGQIANVLVGGNGAWSCSVDLKRNVPNGTGDYLSALFAGLLVNGEANIEAMSGAVARIQAALDVCSDPSEFALLQALLGVEGAPDLELRSVPFEA